jgi:chromosome segregation ATPase
LFLIGENESAKESFSNTEKHLSETLEKIQLLEGSISELEAVKSKAEADLNENSRISLEAGALHAEKTIGDLSSRLTAAQDEKISLVVSQMKNLQESLGQAGSNVNEFAGNVATLEKQILDMQNENAKLLDNVADVEADLNGKTKNYEIISKKYGTLQVEADSHLSGAMEKIQVRELAIAHLESAQVDYEILVQQTEESAKEAKSR